MEASFVRETSDVEFVFVGTKAGRPERRGQLALPIVTGMEVTLRSRCQVPVVWWENWVVGPSRSRQPEKILE